MWCLPTACSISSFSVEYIAGQSGLYSDRMIGKSRPSSSRLISFSGFTTFITRVLQSNEAYAVRHHGICAYGSFSRQCRKNVSLNQSGLLCSASPRVRSRLSSVAFRGLYNFEALLSINALGCPTFPPYFCTLSGPYADNRYRRNPGT